MKVLKIVRYSYFSRFADKIFKIIFQKNVLCKLNFQKVKLQKNYEKIILKKILVNYARSLADPQHTCTMVASKVH
jgi:hypothetical protein